jgi:hypothetical protein
VTVVVVCPKAGEVVTDPTLESPVALLCRELVFGSAPATDACPSPTKA